MDKTAAVLPPDFAAFIAALPLQVIAPVTDTLNLPALEMLAALEDAPQSRVSVMVNSEDKRGAVT